MSKTNKQEKIKKSFYYPSTSTHITEWLDAQENCSKSITQLIYEEFKRSRLKDIVDERLSSEDW